MTTFVIIIECAAIVYQIAYLPNLDVDPIGRGKGTISNAGPGAGTAALDIGKSKDFSTFSSMILNFNSL